MKLTTAVGSFVLAGMAVAALAQTQTYTAKARAADVVRPVIITGEVVRYEPGQVIVVRSDKGEVSYTLAPSLTVPSDVQVGRTVSLTTEPGENGAVLVKRVTTTSVTPHGRVKTTTEETRTHPSGETTTTTTTTISGTVQAYEAGKSVTVTRADGSQVTYMINDASQLPTDLAIGRHIVIYPAAGSEPMVSRIIYYRKK